jgi:hypothetical protein
LVGLCTFSFGVQEKMEETPKHKTPKSLSL